MNALLVARLKLIQRNQGEYLVDGYSSKEEKINTSMNSNSNLLP